MSTQHKLTFNLWLFALLFSIPHFSEAQNIPNKPSPAVFINDYAGFLTQAERNALERKLSQYDQLTSTQIVVVSIESIAQYNASTIEELANIWAIEWGIGQKGSDNGALFLVSKSDRKMRLEVGYGMEGYIPDLRAKQLIDKHVSPNFKQGRYYEGIDELSTAMFSYLEGGFSADDRANTQQSIPVLWYIVIGGIIILIIGLLFWNSTRGAHKRRHKRIKEWLDNDDIWQEVADIYYPSEVAAKRKELEQQYQVLSSDYRSNADTKELYNLIVEIRHNGYLHFTRRNDALLKKAYKKLQYYAQDPMYDKGSCQALENKLSQALSIYGPKATAALTNDEQAQLKHLEEEFKPLLSHPEVLLNFNIPYLQRKIEDKIASTSFWNGFSRYYQTSSINQLKARWTSEYYQFMHISSEREQGRRLYEFYTQKVERLARSPHRFLKAKPRPQNTSYTTVTSSSYGGSFSTGGSSGSSGGSDFGGGDFGGGGASGDW